MNPLMAEIFLQGEYFAIGYIYTLCVT